MEDYLRELRRHLRVGPLAKRRILREIEAHLVDAAEREGEEPAIAAFGSPREVAMRFAGRSRRPALLVGAVASGLAGASALAIVLMLGGQRPALHHSKPAFRIVRSSFDAKGSAGYGPASATTTVKFVVLDRDDNTVAQVTCSLNLGSGTASVTVMSASLDPKTIMGVPTPNCARTS